jgi:hypothetical protein
MSEWTYVATANLRKPRGKPYTIYTEEKLTLTGLALVTWQSLPVHQSSPSRMKRRIAAEKCSLQLFRVLFHLYFH